MSQKKTGWRERLGHEIDRTLAVVAPERARKRLQNRRAVQALYEAGQPGRLSRKTTRPEAGDVSIARAGTRIRDSARDLEQNFDIANGALDVLVANTVGLGVNPAPIARDLSGEPADDFNRTIRKLHRYWSRSPEVTGALEYGAFQALLFRSVFRDGETFTRTMTGSVPGLDKPIEGAVSFWLQGLEADFVPLDKHDPKMNLIQGVQRNQWGRPTLYHVYKQHPSGLQSSQDLMIVKAADMVHTKIIKRLDQVRGISVFHSVINRLGDIKEIDESERVAARVAAAFAAYIKKGEPEDYTGSEDTENDVRTMSIRPGMIMDDLLPGEDIGTIASNRPNNALIPFRDAQLRAAAGGFGSSYSSLSKNYNGTYSAQRQELVEQYAIYGVLWNSFVRPTCQRIYQGFVDAAISANLVEVSQVDPLSLYDCKHSRPPLIWIDPKKEADALKRQREENWISDSQIMHAAGNDPEGTWRQIKLDQDDKEEIGIVVGGQESAVK